MKNIATKEITIIGVTLALITVGSWIVIPFVVPFTLQTFAIYLAVFSIGEKKTLIALLAYCLLGFLGVPVFSGFVGGVGVLAGATGGFLIGFFLSVAVLWAFSPLRDKKIWYIFSIILSLLVCYACGTLFFVKVYMKNTSFFKGLPACVFPFIIPDAIKIGLAYFVAKKVKAINLNA